ncbi:sulfotransferase family protein [Longispora albida]|uniref:sulfotransferase family protein n=1 Tax=Longispora albida TaxID=203523 RepID=UPI000362283B|nr:sulfotransferase [Longispora albida]
MTDLDPHGPFRYLEELKQLVSAVDSEANLTPAGRDRARAAFKNALAGQAHLGALYAAHPEIAELPVRPVFITGLLRTGTTFLQHLLAGHPGLRSPELWELMTPADPGPEAALIAACEDYIAEYYRAAPAFRAIHHLDARLPEECHRLTANSFRDPIYALRYRIPSYTAWLRTQSMVPAFEYHREQLRALLWRRPAPEGAPVVLKCPSHLWHLDELRAVYPGAKVIRMHRSPAVCLPSVSSLTAVVRAARSDTVDKREIGAYWLAEAERVLPGLRPEAGVLDVRYADLVRDPMGTAEKVCEFIGVELTRDARAQMAPSAGSKPPRHEYTAGEFGLSRELLDERFAGYLAGFGLSEEDR